jgi:small subunit ribosomal protein S16
MAVKLRLKRMGNRHRPFYRLSAVDNRQKRDGAVIEELGYYNPLHKETQAWAKLKLDRCAYWLSVGAQPTPTAASLMKHAGMKPKPGTPVEQQELPEETTTTV